MRVCARPSLFSSQRLGLATVTARPVMGASPPPPFCKPVLAANAQGLLCQLPDWKTVETFLKLPESGAALLGRGSFGKVYATIDARTPKAVRVLPLAEGSHLVAATAEVLTQRHLPTHPNLLKGKLILCLHSGVTAAALHVAMPLGTATIEV